MGEGYGYEKAKANLVESRRRAGKVGIWKLEESIHNQLSWAQDLMRMKYDSCKCTGEPLCEWCTLFEEWEDTVDPEGSRAPGNG